MTFPKHYRQSPPTPEMTFQMEMLSPNAETRIRAAKELATLQRDPAYKPDTGEAVDAASLTAQIAATFPDGYIVLCPRRPGEEDDLDDEEDEEDEAPARPDPTCQSAAP